MRVRVPLPVVVPGVKPCSNRGWYSRLGRSIGKHSNPSDMTISQRLRFHARSTTALTVALLCFALNCKSGAAETRTFRAGAAVSNITPPLGCSINGGFQDGNPLGGASDQVRTNPGVSNPNLVQPAGPTDPQVWFISVQATDGRPIALYANYSLHYVGGAGAGHISADYYGAFADRIQELLGADRLDPPFVGAMSNGTSGDINNINFRGGQPKQPPYGQIRIVANDVAQEVARVCKTLSYRDWVPLAVAQKEITLSLRLPPKDEADRARDVMKQSKLFPRMETMEQVYARETVLLSEFPVQVSAPLQVLKIGDLRVSAIPAEAFVEIGLELKRRHPESFTVTLANAYHGYLPTSAQHELGGYETWRARSSCLEVEAAEKIVAGIEALFERLK